MTVLASASAALVPAAGRRPQRHTRRCPVPSPYAGSGGVSPVDDDDDDARREPLLALTGTLTALFAFATDWPYHHTTGALLTLAGLLVALVGVVWPRGMWSGYPLVWRVVAISACSSASTTR